MTSDLFDAPGSGKIQGSELNWPYRLEEYKKLTGFHAHGR